MQTVVEKTKEQDEYRLVFDPREDLITVIGREGNPSGFDASTLDFPVRVVAEITSLCNMRCTYCSQSSNPRGQSMQLENMVKVVDETDAFKVFRLSIRGGEATMHPHFMELWDYAAEKEFITLELVTNGLWIDEDRALHLLEKPTSKLIISLDGREEANARYRGRQQYPRVMGWLLPVLREKADQVRVLTTVSKDNHDYLPEFSRYLVEQGLRYHHFSLLKRIGGAIGSATKCLTRSEMYAFEEALNCVRSQFPSFTPTISSPFYSDRDMTKGIPIQLFTEYFCGAGMKIMCNGRVGISQMIHFDMLSQIDTTGNYNNEWNCLGNLSEGKSLHEIWIGNIERRKEQARLARANYEYVIGLSDTYYAPNKNETNK